MWTSSAGNRLKKKVKNSARRGRHSKRGRRNTLPGQRFARRDAHPAGESVEKFLQKLAYNPEEDRLGRNAGVHVDQENRYDFDLPEPQQKPSAKLHQHGEQVVESGGTLTNISNDQRFHAKTQNSQLSSRRRPGDILHPAAAAQRKRLPLPSVTLRPSEKPHATPPHVPGPPVQTLGSDTENMSMDEDEEHSSLFEEKPSWCEAEPLRHSPRAYR
mmetsp:Transcript_40924/g.65761  ORF Transcript_40924/g.65761 Transcript_40924/m.65761 type:complete len:215 (-) Transcript_40924:969-1613(-)